jgi:hypothetical protein
VRAGEFEGSKESSKTTPKNHYLRFCHLRA